MTTTQYRNFTIKQCDDSLSKYLDAIQSGRMTFWQKFTCDNCFARITVDTPNKLFTIGHCQMCGHFTDLKKMGCGYDVHFKISGPDQPMENT